MGGFEQFRAAPSSCGKLLDVFIKSHAYYMPLCRSQTIQPLGCDGAIGHIQYTNDEYQVLSNALMFVCNPICWLYIRQGMESVALTILI